MTQKGQTGKIARWRKKKYQGKGVGEEEGEKKKEVPLAVGWGGEKGNNHACSLESGGMQS